MLAGTSPCIPLRFVVKSMPDQPTFPSFTACIFSFSFHALSVSRLSQRPVFHWRSSSLRLIHGCLSSGVLGAQRAGWLAGCASVSILSLSSSLFLSLCLRVIAALLDMLFCFSVVLLFGLRVLFGLLAGLSRFGYQVLVLRAGLGWAGLAHGPDLSVVVSWCWLAREARCRC
ncbi:hypothetical protein IWZ00DRAFT_518164 [Phyllosticta capitalensis]